MMPSNDLILSQQKWTMYNRKISSIHWCRKYSPNIPDRPPLPIFRDIDSFGAIHFLGVHVECMIAISPLSQKNIWSHATDPTAFLVGYKIRYMVQSRSPFLHEKKKGQILVRQTKKSHFFGGDFGTQQKQTIYSDCRELGLRIKSIAAPDKVQPVTDTTTQSTRENPTTKEKGKGRKTKERNSPRRKCGKDAWLWGHQIRLWGADDGTLRLIGFSGDWWGYYRAPVRGCQMATRQPTREENLPVSGVAFTLAVKDESAIL